MNGFRICLLLIVLNLAFIKVLLAQDSTVYRLKKSDYIVYPVSLGLAYATIKNYSVEKTYSIAFLNYLLDERLMNDRYHPGLEKASSYLSYGTGLLVLAIAANYENKNGKKGNYLTRGFKEALLYGELILWERSLVAFVKQTDMTPRPYVYNSDLSSEFVQSKGRDAFYSFYSAHTSLVFANALDLL